MLFVIVLLAVIMMAQTTNSQPLITNDQPLTNSDQRELPDHVSRLLGEKAPLTTTLTIPMTTMPTVATNGSLKGDKEKSPMCLVNELCRYNGITCQYELIEETGAPHSKTFSVLLKLDDGKEEYRASGPSIRKAQHAAASQALVTTKFPFPSPKSERKASRYNPQLTPTVELNVLAMKRGEAVQYHVYEQPQRANPIATLTPFPTPTAAPELYDFRGMYHQRYHLHRGTIATWYCATVTVGERQFSGKGKTAQVARHAAAEEALKTLRNLPQPDKSGTGSLIDLQEEINSKSPVSLVYEVALKRNMTVKFEVVSESGPSHMPSFVIKCIVGDMVAEGHGNGKKIAKRRAAAAMLVELKKLEPLPVVVQSNGSTTNGTMVTTAPIKPVRKNSNPKKKRNPRAIKTRKGEKFIKDKTDDTTVTSVSDQNEQQPNASPLDSGDNGTEELAVSSMASYGSSSLIENKPSDDQVQGPNSQHNIHPTSRLIQLQQAKKEKEPRFRLISEKELEPRKKEFTVECSIPIPRNSRLIGINTRNGELTTIGIGLNKKAAKKQAAEEMLKILGYSSSPSSSKNTSNPLETSSPSPPPSTPTSAISEIQHSSPNSLMKIQDNLRDNIDSIGDNMKVRKVKFVEASSSTTTPSSLNNNYSLERLPNVATIPKYGRQIVPGLLFMLDMEQTANPSENNNVNERKSGSERWDIVD